MKKSVTIDGVTFTGTLTPEERMVMYYKDGSGHPGSPAEFDIESIEGDGVKLVELLNSKIPPTHNDNPHIDLWEILNELCLENLGDEI
jgi:hypothetical protein